jgi:hypothetical protein
MCVAGIDPTAFHRISPMTPWIAGYAFIAYCTWNAFPWPNASRPRSEQTEIIFAQVFTSVLWPFYFTTRIIQKYIASD